MKTFMKFLEEIQAQAQSIPKIIIYPDMQGSDNADDVTHGQMSDLPVSACLGNEPGKDFNYFKNGRSDKGLMKDYVTNMIKAVKEQKPLPPIKVFNHPILSGKYSVVDGNHRLAAYKIGNLPKIKALIINDDDIVLAIPGTKYQAGVTPQTISLSQAREQRIDLRSYFTTKDLMVPDKDPWVQSLRKIL